MDKENVEIATGISVSFRVVRMTTDVDPGEFCRGKTERPSFFLVPHEQIQMQVKKHIPRYPNPLIFAFLHFMNTTRENDFIWRLVVPGVV